MPTSSTSTHAGGRSSTAAEGRFMPVPSTPPAGSSVGVVPALCLAVVAAVVFQLLWGGLALTSFFLKLFIYVSFALLCVLAGSLVLLVRKSPLKVVHFHRDSRHFPAPADLFTKRMVGTFLCIHISNSFSFPNEIIIRENHYYSIYTVIYNFPRVSQSLCLICHMIRCHSEEPIS